MIKIITVTILALIAFGTKAYSQELTGHVMDGHNRPVAYATVVLRGADSTFINAVVTDTTGMFFLKNCPLGKLRLMVQHLNFFYREIEIEVKSNANNVGTVILEEKPHSLREVVVVAKSPQVTVNNGILSYNVAYFTSGKAVSTAFEVVKEIPGVTGSDDEIDLIGAGEVSIVLNGKLTTMSYKQLCSLLQSIPASRVKNVEVMYSAPARYNVNGALINVVTDNKNAGDKSTQGEVSTEYKQSHYSSGSLRGNLFYQTPKFSLDILAVEEKGTRWSKDNLFSSHIYSSQTIEIDQTTRGISKYDNYKFRLGADRTFKNKDNISFSYYFDGSNSDTETTADNSFAATENYDTRSVDKSDGSNGLHNTRLQYSGHNGINAGVDFTHYFSPDDLHFIEEKDGALTNDYLNNSLQKVSRWMAFANNTAKLSKSWLLNYGVNGGLNLSDNHIEYLYPQAGGYVEDPDKRINNSQKEYTGNAFVGTSGKFSNMSLTVSLKTEYFHSDYELNGKKSILWSGWVLFPTATISYNISKKGILQFNLSSSKSNPSYWAISPQTTQVNSYMFIEGNPELKPSRTYRGQLLYILNQKYMFMTFATYNPNAFQQLPYQNDNMMTVYRFENLDFTLNAGLAVILPFKAGFWNTRITIQGFRIQEKMSDFYGKPFDNKNIATVIMCNNSFTISKVHPNLNFQLDGRYQSSGVQGIYKLGEAYNVSSALKWTLKGDSYLSLQYNNILKRQTPRPIIVDWAGQYSRRINEDLSSLIVSFTWKFGNYKEKNYNKVDDSRFGR